MARESGDGGGVAGGGVEERDGRAVVREGVDGGEVVGGLCGVVGPGRVCVRGGAEVESEEERVVGVRDEHVGVYW